jgi:hypothetical protein
MWVKAGKTHLPDMIEAGFFPAQQPDRFLLEFGQAKYTNNSQSLQVCLLFYK